MEVIEITDQDFEKEVLQFDLPVFICFTTSWCGSCFPTCMFVSSIAEEYGEMVKFVRCDIERCTEVAKKYRIEVVPTIALFQDCEIVKKVTGFQEKQTLRHLLETYL
ncbi:MAG: thioredoxin domain-containing protein [Chloroflexota bacterium]|nr:thioredoxin domain-containing protein [Chloroflexota bacterium]